MRSLLSSALICSLVFPLAASADSFEILQSETQRFEATHTMDKADQVAEGAEALLQSSSLFSGTDTENSASSRRAGSIESEGFVVFRINAVPYTLRDVPVGIWFAPYVRDVADRGIVSGYRNAQGIPTGFFGPDKSVSIEELAKMAVQSSGGQVENCALPGRNLAAVGRWSERYLACTEQRGFVVFSDGTVDPSRPATRAEVVITILQAFGISLRSSDGQKALFTDVSPSTLYVDAIYTAVSDGLVTGYVTKTGSTFGPDKPINRAEVSKMLSMALQLYGSR